ncbi:hypothetical protein SFUMM280S_07759 [Streptomyces fumanus]
MPTNAEWRKSSYSSDQGGECVEVATPPHRAGAAVRDSKLPTGPVLTLTPRLSPPSSPGPLPEGPPRGRAAREPMKTDSIRTGPQWRRSTYSSDQGGNCVEIAMPPHRVGVAVRDSRTRRAPY